MSEYVFTVTNISLASCGIWQILIFHSVLGGSFEEQPVLRVQIELYEHTNILITVAISRYNQ